MEFDGLPLARAKSSAQGWVLRSLIFLCVSAAASIGQAAEWNTITHSDMDSNTTTSVAIIKNDDGYSLEVYKDSVDAVRARFTLAKELISIPVNFCPTFQIDNGQPTNRSVNDAPCLSDKTWAEFILGYIENGQVNSSAIAGIMNGVTLKLRFMLENGDYRETLFSLRGSKRAMISALGANISVSSITQN